MNVENRSCQTYAIVANLFIFSKQRWIINLHYWNGSENKFKKKHNHHDSSSSDPGLCFSKCFSAGEWMKTTTKHAINCDICTM